MFGGKLGHTYCVVEGRGGFVMGNWVLRGGRRSIVQGQSVFFSDFLGIITKYSPRNLDYRNAPNFMLRQFKSPNVF